jgi:cytochrome bd-type quinol oxidase subunit 2
MWFSQALGWGIPAIGVVLAFVLSGVSFRFGQTCHINHKNSLADLWIPLLIFAGLTIIIQLGTFGYCIKVYLASLADNSASTEGSGMPSYTNSIRTMTPKQAYRRVRRVIALQWRGIAIVLIIIADVIFFSIVFVFQDNTIERVKNDMQIAFPWISCLALSGGDKSACLDEASPLVVNQATVGAVLFLLGVSHSPFLSVPKSRFLTVSRN